MINNFRKEQKNLSITLKTRVSAALSVATLLSHNFLQYHKIA